MWWHSFALLSLNWWLQFHEYMGFRASHLLRENESNVPKRHKEAKQVGIIMHVTNKELTGRYLTNTWMNGRRKVIINQRPKQAWWFTHIVLALCRLRKNDHQFEASIFCVVRHCLRNKRKQDLRPGAIETILQCLYVYSIIASQNSMEEGFGTWALSYDTSYLRWLCILNKWFMLITTHLTKVPCNKDLVFMMMLLGRFVDC